MAKAKTEEILRRQKEAKQKKLLFVLGPIFLLLMVWQGPGYVKMLTGGSSPEPVATATETGTTDPTAAPSTSTPAPDPSASPAPSTAAPAAGTPAAATDGSALPESDQPAAAGEGQLVSFDRFIGRDPFKQIVSTSTASSGGTPPVTTGGFTGGTTGGSTTGGSTSGGSTGSGGNGSSGNGSGGSPPATVPASVTVSVNGTKETLEVDTQFPESEKLFTVAKLTKTSAYIGLVSGQFSNGKQSIEVKVGKTLNLVSQPDGIRYRIKVVRINLK